MFSGHWHFATMMNIFSSEILRIIDSVQMTDSHKVATPVDWKVSENRTILSADNSMPNIFNPFFSSIIRSATIVWFCQPLKTKIVLASSQKVLKLWNCHQANAIYERHHIRHQHPIEGKKTDQLWMYFIPKKILKSFLLS